MQKLQAKAKSGVGSARSVTLIGKSQGLPEGLSCLQFISSRDNRRPEYRVNIIVCHDGAEKIVIKSPATDAAKAFIRTILERERKTDEYLRKNFEVLRGTLDGDYIRYRYLPHSSLRDQMLSCMAKGSVDKASDLLKQYVERICSLETVETVPVEFLKVVNLHGTENKERFECLTQGPLDLVPRNISIDGSRWIVIDSKWSFDFPVPLVFILFRAIVCTSISLQAEIRKCASGDYPVVGLFRIGPQTYYVPAAWMEYVTDPQISLDRMCKWEMRFQRYVTTDKKSMKIIISPKTQTHFSNISILMYGSQAKRLKRLLRRLLCVR